jgi:glucose/arabinose dehydrogenase
MHDEANRFGIDLSLAQSPDFADWVGSPPDPEPTTTTTSASTTSGPTSTPTSEPPPDGEPLPFPETCNLEGQFPLEVADGWKFVKLAGDLRTPRGITVDNNGNILLVQVGVGLSVHTFGADGCIASSKTLISRPGLTHGVALTPDGNTLYVSSISTVWRYTYDAATQSVSDETIVVANMYPASHSTRTVVVPPATPDLLVVSLGSDGNLDWDAVAKETGRAIVKVFDISQFPEGGYDYSSEGWYLGYGLRNEVAIAVDANNM